MCFLEGECGVVVVWRAIFLGFKFWGPEFEKFWEF